MLDREGWGKERRTEDLWQERDGGLLYMRKTGPEEQEDHQEPAAW
jgi:hypothetical protein